MRVPGAHVDEAQGPGLKQSDGRVDAVSTVSLVFAVLGLMPSTWLKIGGVHAFGPVAFTAILSIVGVLFGFLAVFRHGELKDQRALIIGSVGAGLGLVRLFIYPFFGL